MKIGSDYDPEWIEHQFQTYIVPYCNGKEGTADFRPAQKAFLNCLSEGLAPRASAKSLKDKLEILLKRKTDAKESTRNALACIDFLKFQIELMDKPQMPPPKQSLRHSLIVKGDSKVLDTIFEKVDLGEQSRIERHGDPADVKLTDADFQKMLGGKPMVLGTTRIEMYFNHNPELVKRFILEKFPNVTFH